MPLKIEDGFLVETFPRSSRVHRLARLAKSRPKGRVQMDLAVTVDETRYAVGFHFEPGVRQGRAVAWPEGQD